MSKLTRLLLLNFASYACTGIGNGFCAVGHVLNVVFVREAGEEDAKHAPKSHVYTNSKEVN